MDGNAEHLLFDTLLTQFREHGLLRARGRQRSDSTHVLAAIRALNRLECVGATIRHALNNLAVIVPDWVLAHSHPDWLERYGPRMEDYGLPESKDERVAFATTIGADGLALLQAVDAADAPDLLRSIPAVLTLRHVWIQNFTWTDQGTLRWRTNEEIPPSAQYIGSPYDLDARYSQKRSTSWVGYKVHLWEARQARCPAGCTSINWNPTVDPHENPVIRIKFAMRDCQACDHRSACTDGQRRCISVRPREQHEALQQRRKRQRTETFKDEYAKRAGVEGTVSQGVRKCGIRRARYVGLPKTRLQHLATAAALNLLRIADWLDETPRAKTRHSTFERLYRQAQAA